MLVALAVRSDVALEPKANIGNSPSLLPFFVFFPTTDSGKQVFSLTWALYFVSDEKTAPQIRQKIFLGISSSDIPLFGLPPTAILGHAPDVTALSTCPAAMAPL